MTETTEQSGRERGVIYTIVMVALIVLAVIALLMFRSGRESAEAEEKAAQLTQSLEEAGMQTPSTEQIVAVLGDDGGTVCADPNAALSRGLALAALSTGAGGPGSRPVIVEDRVLRSQLLIISVYCPDEFPKYEEFIDKLETANVS